MPKNGFMSKCFEKFKKSESNKKSFCVSPMSINHFESMEFYGKKVVDLSRKIKRGMKKIQKIAEIMSGNIKEEKRIKYLEKADNIANIVNKDLKNLQELLKIIDELRKFMSLNNDLKNNCTEVNFTRIFPPGAV